MRVMEGFINKLTKHAEKSNVAAIGYILLIAIIVFLIWFGALKDYQAKKVCEENSDSIFSPCYEAPNGLDSWETD